MRVIWRGIYSDLRRRRRRKKMVEETVGGLHALLLYCTANYN